jgi:hypothetical protein
MTRLIRRLRLLLARPCPDCGARRGQECTWACSSNWR